MRDVEFKLTQDEAEVLLTAFGMAIGASMLDNRKLAYSFARLLNKMFADQPGYVPYGVPRG